MAETSTSQTSCNQGNRSITSYSRTNYEEKTTKQNKWKVCKWYAQRIHDKGDKGTGEQGTRSGRLWLCKGRHVIYIYKNTHNPLPIFLYNLKRKCNLWRKLSLLALQKRFLFFSSRHHTLLFAIQTQCPHWERLRGVNLFTSVAAEIMATSSYVIQNTFSPNCCQKWRFFFLKYLLSTRQSFPFSNTWVIEPTGFSPGTSPGGKLNIQWILLSAELNSLFDV